MNQKNRDFSLYAKDEMRQNQEKRFEELDDSIYLLTKKLNKVASERTGLKRNRDSGEDVEKANQDLLELKLRKMFLKTKLARAWTNLEKLKHDMKYEEPQVAGQFIRIRQ
jgi:hypothetical protein